MDISNDKIPKSISNESSLSLSQQGCQKSSLLGGWDWVYGGQVGHKVADLAMRWLILAEGWSIFQIEEWLILAVRFVREQNK